MRNFDLALRAVNDRLAKRDGEADRRAQKLVVVGIVVAALVDFLQAVDTSMTSRIGECGNF